MCVCSRRGQNGVCLCALSHAQHTSFFLLYLNLFAQQQTSTGGGNTSTQAADAAAGTSSTGGGGLCVYAPDEDKMACVCVRCRTLNTPHSFSSTSICLLPTRTKLACVCVRCRTLNTPLPPSHNLFKQTRPQQQQLMGLVT